MSSIESNDEDDEGDKDDDDKGRCLELVLMEGNCTLMLL
jgi:hypothetical protein